MIPAPNSAREQGFTAVELLVTIIVTAMFAVSFYQLFTVVNQSSTTARNRATASDIAYANLRRYASSGVTPNNWSPPFVCDTASGGANTNDVTINTGAAGSTLSSGSPNPTTVGLPAPVTYSVKALAVFGCSGANVNKPIRVESTVTFGPQNTVIKHATLVGY